MIRWPLSQDQHNTKQKLMRMQSMEEQSSGAADAQDQKETVLQNVRILHKWGVFYACTWADAISQNVCSAKVIYYSLIQFQ